MAPRTPGLTAVALLLTLAAVCSAARLSLAPRTARSVLQNPASEARVRNAEQLLLALQDSAVAYIELWQDVGADESGGWGRLPLAISRPLTIAGPEAAPREQWPVVS